VIARRGSVHAADDRNLVETWDFRDNARLGDLAQRFITSSFRPTITGPHAWLLRIVHNADVVLTDNGGLRWISTGEAHDYLQLFNTLGRTRRSSWQISDASGHRFLHWAPLADTIRPGATGQRLVEIEYLAFAGLLALPDFKDRVRGFDAKR